MWPLFSRQVTAHDWTRSYGHSVAPKWHDTFLWLAPSQPCNHWMVEMTVEHFYFWAFLFLGFQNRLHKMKTSGHRLSFCLDYAYITFGAGLYLPFTRTINLSTTVAVHVRFYKWLCACKIQRFTHAPLRMRKMNGLAILHLWQARVLGCTQLALALYAQASLHFFCICQTLVHQVQRVNEWQNKVGSKKWRLSQSQGCLSKIIRTLPHFTQTCWGMTPHSATV